MVWITLENAFYIMEGKYGFVTLLEVFTIHINLKFTYSSIYELGFSHLENLK